MSEFLIIYTAQGYNYRVELTSDYPFVNTAAHVRNVAKAIAELADENGATLYVGAYGERQYLETFKGASK